MSLVDAIWNGDGALERLARGLLWPAEQAYAAIVSGRNAGFDARTPARATLAAVSVGNLTVGGTGKTPVSAYCAGRLAAQGARPAIVLRGYGDDEWKVHGLLNPGMPVVVAADRVAGMITARSMGADCAVLDDAFQHRRAARVADLVLVSADQWREPVRLLPAGPFREPMSALRRASLCIVTVKAAGADRVAQASAAISRHAPDTPQSVVRLVPGTLRLATMLPSGERGVVRAARDAARDPMLTHPPSWLQGRTVASVCAIGNPDAWEAQLRSLGAALAVTLRYPDHHAFSAADAAQIARAADGTDGAVCTLKDAVKLRDLWPREAPPLWYVSQSVVVDRGAEALDRALARVLAARAATALTAG